MGTRIRRRASPHRPPENNSLGQNWSFPCVPAREQLRQRFLRADMHGLDAIKLVELHVGRHYIKAVKTARVQATVFIHYAAVHWVPGRSLGFSDTTGISNFHS